MPVFAKLSRRFYDVVGEDVAQQLVDWLNDVERELTWRASLRLHNELRHARLHDEMRHARTRTQQMVPRSGMPDSLRSSEAYVKRDSADLKAELHRFRSDLIWWMFLYCVSTLLGTLVLLIALR